MKLVIKSLSGQQFTVDVEPANTILQVKEKIQESKKHEIAQQKLLKKGQILNDNQTIEELGITESDFLVVMVQAKKAQPPVQQPPAQQPPVQQPVQQQPPPVQQVIQPPQSQPVSTQQTTPITTGSQFVSGPEFEKIIEELISMGFPREECLNAMRAAFNNPERAAEYLINGIPPNLIHHTRPQHTHHPLPIPPTGQVTGGQSTQQVPQTAPPPAIQPGSGAFAQLRQAYQQNPQAVIGMLPQLLENIRQTNPALHQQLSQNPQMLLQLISGLAPQQGGARQIQLSLQEKGDIETLKSFGFTEQDSIEGYLTCDKNVEMAVNYLLERQANGDLFSQHVQRERANPQNQQQPPPPAGGEQGPQEEDQEDDDDVYQ